MLRESDELNSLFLFALNLGTYNYFITPILYGILIYSLYRLRFLNFNIIFSFLASSFILILILTPSSPGWLVWASPFLTLLYKNNNSKLIFWIFTLSNFLLIILNYNPIILENLNSDIILLLSKPKDLINSFNFIISLLIIYDILIKGIKLSDPLRLNKKPLSLGIAGDSSTGKDTIVESFMKIIPKQSIQHISGDDYHLWDRKKENWKIITHLNPMANNLYKLSEDLLDLINNKFIYKRHYDHKSGKMTRSERINSRELLISSGLHTLYIPYSNNLFDLRVFVSMDEKLRTSLKINRDVKERGKSIDKVLKSLKERKIDSNNFIKVQKVMQI